ncbi:MAG: exopolysaccharide biosynthesis protein [Rickettsiales bacterium]|nr:exopolysaccharide biosynthesis protein [Rickettsiales bacterium]
MEDKRASDILDKIKDVPNVDKISIGTLIENNSESPYFIVLLVTLIVLAPIPFISNAFSVISIIVMYQVISGKKTLVLPKFILNIKIKRTSLVYSIEKLSPLFRRVEFLTRNRLLFLTNKKFADIFLFILSILSVSPVPFIAFFSGCGILFVIFGLLNKDGLFILIGVLLGLLNLGLNLVALLVGRALLMKMLFG